MTSRVMDSANLERIEVLRGPASLMSGEGAAGGSVNFVTRTPHTGAVENELFVSYGSFNTWRSSAGSGGSTAEYWLRGGVDWAVAPGVAFRDQVYYYAAKREWKNAEVYAFGGDAINSDRFYIAHDQSLTGNNAQLTWDAKLAGFENRMVVALEVSTLDFKRPGAGAPFGGDTVSVVDPNRGVYAPLTLQRQTARIDTTAGVLEDRLKLTRTLAVIAGVRHEHIDLDRGSTDPTGADRAGFPFGRKWRPTTGGSFSGNTPPNAPRVVTSAGASYRFATTTPVEAGASVRHVGDRYNTDANDVKLLAYTVADAYVAVEVRKTRLAMRVRNLTNERYAVWGDPFYPDQILLGARRSYEVSGALRF